MSLLESIKRWFWPRSRQKGASNRWKEVDEKGRVRTFLSTERSLQEGVVKLTTVTVTEYATSHQERFLRQLGFDPAGLDKRAASLLITRILRPISYAISKTFKNRDILEKDDEKVLQVAISQWEYSSSLPRWGPYSSWEDLEAFGDDSHRSLTKEERMRITDIAFSLLPPEVFFKLQSNGVKAYKDQLDRQLLDGA